MEKKISEIEYFYSNNINIDVGCLSFMPGDTVAFLDDLENLALMFDISELNEEVKVLFYCVDAQLSGGVEFLVKKYDLNNIEFLYDFDSSIIGNSRYVFFNERNLRFSEWLGLIESYDNFFASISDKSYIKKILPKLKRITNERYYIQDLSSGNTITEKIQKFKYDVTVVIPAYNVEAYIEKCIDSLLSQSTINLQIIVVDDGSTDNTKEILLRYDIYDHVVIIEQSNSGCSSARNKGLDYAKGEFVAFVDSDDYVEGEMYSDLFSQALFDQSDIVYSCFTEYYQLDEKMKNVNERINCAEGINSGVVLKKNDIHYLQPAIWRCLYRKSFLKNNGINFPSPIKRFDDLYFKFLTVMHASRISFVPRCYYVYRLERIGQDTAINDKRLYIHFEIFELLRFQVKKDGHANDELYLKIVQLASHKWAFKKIKPRYKILYLINAFRCLNKRVYLGNLRALYHLLRANSHCS